MTAWRLIVRTLLWLLVGLATALAVLVGGVWLAAFHPGVTAWAVARIPGVQVSGPSGGLMGHFQADAVDIGLPRGGHLRLQKVSWTGLRLRPSLSAAWHLGVHLDTLSAERVVVDWVAGPADPKPLAAPTDLSLPLNVSVGRLRVKAAQAKWWGAQPLQDIDARLSLAGSALPWSRHSLKLKELAWQGWHLKGSATVGTAGKLPVKAQLALSGSTAEQGRGEIQLSVGGAVTQLDGDARLDWRAKAGATAQQARVQAKVAPFMAWPVREASADMAHLNLADVLPKGPQTDLSGQISLRPAGQQDLALKVAVRNAVAGAWDAGHVPLANLAGGLTWRDAQALHSLSDPLRFGGIDLQAQLAAGSGRGPASVRMQGAWDGQQTLVAVWRGLDLRALDGRAPPLRLQGNLSVTPDRAPAAEQLAALRSQITLEADGQYLPRASGPASGADAGAGSGRGLGQGGKAAGAVPVKVSLKGWQAPGEAVVDRLRLQAGGASAEVSQGHVKWGGAPAWSASAQWRVSQFDPRVWLPWPVGLSGAAHALNGEGRVAVDADWRGDAMATLGPSTLAGLPVQGHAEWHSPADVRRMRLSADVQAAGNQAQVQADVPWQPTPEGPRPTIGLQWQAAVQAPALNALESLAAGFGLSHLAGSLSLDAKGQGLWPPARTQGQAQARGLQLAVGQGSAWQLATGQAQWHLDLGALETGQGQAAGKDAGKADEAWQLSLALADVKGPAVTLPQLQVQLTGHAAQHRLQAGATIERRSQSGAPQTVQVSLAANGGWQGAKGRWQGQVSELVARLMGTPVRELLKVEPVTLAAGWQGHAADLTVGATTLSLMGAPLRLQQAHWRSADLATDPQGELDLLLALEPLNVSDLLASWQPLAGWGGDLMVAGQVLVQHSARHPWGVDAVIERRSGDLSLAEPTIEGSSAQALGIQGAKLALQARDGVWTLTQRFEGRRLGLLTGQVVVRSAHPDGLPDADSPLSGNLDLAINSLRPWGTWLPAGWRVSGQVKAQVRASGSLRAPRLEGEVNGQGLGLSQALLGVNLSDGVLRLALQGQRLALEQFTAHDGSQGGTLSVTGDATLIDTPTARLKVQADHFAALQRVDRRVVASGLVDLMLSQDNLQAQGQVKIDEGLIDITHSDAPTVGDDVNVVNRPGSTEEAADDAGGAGSQRQIAVQLDVDLGKQLRLKGRGVDGRLTGGLRLTTPTNRLRANGTIKVEQGTYAAYGQKLVIERGNVNFVGPLDNPKLDILAMRAQSASTVTTDVKVGVMITGTAQDPRIRLYSDPSMSDTEKLSWLILGRGPTELGGADIGLLQTAAVALLSGENAGPGSNIVTALGLDELSVRQSDTATTRETVVNIGKQVSKYWYVGYERNLNATSGSWQLIYRLARRFQVRAQAGIDNALDFIWSFRWD